MRAIADTHRRRGPTTPLQDSSVERSASFGAGGFTCDAAYESANGIDSPSPISNSATLARSCPTTATGVESTTLLVSRDRAQGPIFLAMHPRNARAVSEADDELHPHLDPATLAADDPDDVRVAIPRRHHVDRDRSAAFIR